MVVDKAAVSVTIALSVIMSSKRLMTLDKTTQSTTVKLATLLLRCKYI